MKRITCSILTLVLLFQFSVYSFASENNNNLNSHSDTSILYNKNSEYKPVSLDEEIKGHIDNSLETFTLDVLGEKVNYYKGEDYVIVEESQGYFKIDFLSDGTMYVNDLEVESRVVDLDNENGENNDEPVLSPLAWKLNKTTQREYNVIGFAVSLLLGAVTGFAGAKVSAMLSTKIPAVFEVVGGAIVGLLVGGRVAEHYVSIIKKEYYKVPVTTPRPEIMSKSQVYHGPKYNRYRTYLFST